MRYLSGGNIPDFPVLGMGTWGFGGREEPAPDNDDAGQIAALQEGIEAGFSLIDTAEYYAGGYAETLVGKAISGFDRSKLFLVSKVWKTHLRRDDLLRAVENSLSRLKSDYLDCCLYHQVNEDVPLAESIGAMNELVERKLVRSIGVSNFSAARMLEAQRLSDVPLVLNQVHCNLAVREAEIELAGVCRENRIILQAWRPLRDLEATPETLAICREREITFAQLALAYLLHKENTAVITAMKSRRHLKETMAALDVKFSAAELAVLDAYPVRRECRVPLK